MFLLCSAIGWGQTADIRLNNSSQILVPLPGNTQNCAETGSNLTFQVNNESAGSGNIIDLAVNSLVATLTVSGNTFAPSGTTTTVTFTSATTSNATSTQYISAPGFASFAWPNTLKFNGTGTTTVEIEIAAIGNADPVSTNNTVTYDIGILANPNPPNLSTNFGSGTPIDICQGDTVIITSSTVGDEYEFYRNGTLLGSRQTSNTFTTSYLGDNDYVNVIAYYTSGRGRKSNNIFFSIDAI